MSSFAKFFTTAFSPTANDFHRRRYWLLFEFLKSLHRDLFSPKDITWGFSPRMNSRTIGLAFFLSLVLLNQSFTVFMLIFEYLSNDITWWRYFLFLVNSANMVFCSMTFLGNIMQPYEEPRPWLAYSGEGIVINLLDHDDRIAALNDIREWLDQNLESINFAVYDPNGWYEVVDKLTTDSKYSSFFTFSDNIAFVFKNRKDLMMFKLVFAGERMSRGQEIVDD
jgi:hypothetical protein